MIPEGWNQNFMLNRDQGKMSFKRRDYETVAEKQ